MSLTDTPKQPTTAVVIPSSASCEHKWLEKEPMPARWTCGCGTIVYRAYEDYCDD